MKITKIVGFGDSWMYGDELVDPKLLAQGGDHQSCWVQNTDYRNNSCFLGLLGHHYNVPTENFGVPGGSLQSTLWTYLWWLLQEADPSSCLIIVFLTEPDRQSFLDPHYTGNLHTRPWEKFWHSTWVEYGSSTVPSDFTDMIKRYMILTNDQITREWNYLQTVLFFDGQSARLKLPLLQFHITDPAIEFPIHTIPWPDHNWIRFFRDHPQNQNRELIHANGHPNEQGHMIIRDLLIPEIDRVILTQ